MSKNPQRSLEQAKYPMSGSALRKLVLDQAGISQEDLARAVGKAFKENERLISATRVEVKVDTAGEIHEVEIPDNTARQRAIDSIYDFAGARPQTVREGGNGGPTIVLNLPDYYSREYIERTSKDIEVDAVPVTSDDRDSE